MVTIAAAVALASMVAWGATRADAGAIPVVIGGSTPDAPAISGTKVVWADRRYGSYDVFLYDALTGRTTRLTDDPADQTHPVISGDRVVWVDYRSGNADLWCYNLVSHEATQLATEDGAGRDQFNPAVSGDWLVYQDGTSNGYSYSNIAFNLRTGLSPTDRVPFPVGFQVANGEPRVAGDLAVWARREAGRADYDVWMMRLSTRAAGRVTGSGPQNEGNPDTDGTYVVWSEIVGEKANIRALDTRSDVPFDVCTARGGQVTPRVEGGIAYWTHVDGRRPMHIDYRSLPGGAIGPLATYATGSVAEFDASGTNASWLERDRIRWRVRGLFNEGVSLADRITQAVPLEALWSSIRLVAASATSDREAPVVTGFSVTPRETGVSARRRLTVYFSEPLAPGTVNGSSVFLVDDVTGKVVRTRLRYSALARSVTLVPVRALGTSTYSIHAAGILADRAGNALASPSAVSFATGQVFADLVAPGDLGALSAEVSGTTKVTISWRRSGDLDIKEYRVKRYYRPMDSINWSTAATVAIVNSATTMVTTNTIADVPAGTGETVRRYEYYYAARAVDTSNNLGSIVSVVPNPHGTARIEYPRTNICGQCHSVHGGVNYSRAKLGARSAAGCYGCHGSTNATTPPDTTAYGAASTMDIQAEFGDDAVISTAGPDLADRSIHRDSVVASLSTQTECSMCHAPHKNPANYYNTNSYEASTSYPKLLRGNPSYVTTYLVATGSYDKKFCWGCHGGGVSVVPYLDRSDVANGKGAVVYANSGGDHETQFTDAGKAAHRATIVPASARPSTDATGPLVSCWACHGVHAAKGNSITDWRLSATSTTNYQYAGLCYECHANASSTSGHETLSKGTNPTATTVPYTWNDRDIKVEFGRASHHPTTPISTGYWGDSTVTAWTQTTKADFAVDTLTQAVATSGVGDGAAVLATYTTTIQPPDASLIMGVRGGTAGLEAYDAAANSWTVKTAPPWAPAVGSSSFTPTGGIMWTTRAGSAADIATYTAATNSWSAGKAGPVSPGTGADMASNPGSSCIYMTAAGGASALVGWHSWTKNVQGTFTFRGDTAGGTNYVALNLGTGSAMSYAPVAKRLFILNSNGTGGDGRLYYKSSPGTPTGNVDFTRETPVVPVGTARYNAMTLGVDGNGNEFLIIAGRNTAGRNTIVVTNLAGVLATRSLGFDIGAGTAQAEGTHLTWDGVNGGRIYGEVGNAVAQGTKYLDIPMDAATGSFGSAWTALSVNPSWGNSWATGSSLARTSYTPAPVTGSYYRTNGTVMTDTVLPVSGAYKWGTVDWTETNPSASTNVTVTAALWNGSGWTTVASGVDTGPIDLTGYGTSAYPKLQLTAYLKTTNQAQTPALEDWTATSIKWIFYPTTGAVTCVNCHNVHVVTTGTANAWSASRTVDPANTKALWTGTITDLCLKCHTAAPPTETRTDVQFVPYSPGFTSWPLFPGWSKATGEVDFKKSAHYTATAANGKALCENCHDPHGSNFQRLLAWTKPAGVTWTGTAAFNGTRDNTSANMTTAAKDYLCLNCHGDGSSATVGKAAGAPDIWTPLEGIYSHPTTPVSGIHSDTEQGSNLGTGTPSKRHAECVDCHNPHSARAGIHTSGTVNAGNALLGATGVEPAWPTDIGGTAKGIPTAYAGTSIDTTTSGTHYEAQVCFKCHSSYASAAETWTVYESRTATQYTFTDQAMEFNPNNQGGHNVTPYSTWPATSTAEGLPFQWELTDVDLALTGGWTVNSRLTCSDCHGSDAAGARGPHGSGSLGMLDAPTAGRTQHWWQVPLNQWTTSGFICAKCHTSEATAQGHTTGTSSHSSYACEYCHVRIPHGWKRPRLLRRVTGGTVNGIPADTLPYAQPGLSRGLNSVLFNAKTTGVQGNMCADNGCQHANTASVWP